MKPIYKNILKFIGIAVVSAAISFGYVKHAQNASLAHFKADFRDSIAKVDAEYQKKITLLNGLKMAQNKTIDSLTNVVNNKKIIYIETKEKFYESTDCDSIKLYADSALREADTIIYDLEHTIEHRDIVASIQDSIISEQDNKISAITNMLDNAADNIDKMNLAYEKEKKKNNTWWNRNKFSVGIGIGAIGIAGIGGIIYSVAK